MLCLLLTGASWLALQGHHQSPPTPSGPVSTFLFREKGLPPSQDSRPSQGSPQGEWGQKLAEVGNLFMVGRGILLPAHSSEAPAGCVCVCGG